MKLTDELPRLWKISDTGSAFKISDAQGRGVPYVYSRRDDALKSDYLSRDQAVEMAKVIARLSRKDT